MAEELHFGRAAQRCNVSQPPFSVAIRQLEDELGFGLVDREHVPIRLTPAGMAFYDETAKTLSQMQQAVQTAERFSKGLSGILKIGISASMLGRGIPEVIDQMRNDMPDLAIRLLELSTREQIMALQRGEIDYGFVHTIMGSAKLHFEKLLSEPFMLCVPREHPASGTGSVKLSDFSHESFILFPRNVSPNYYDQVISLCVSAGFHPIINHEIRQWMAVISGVASNLGVALVPRSLQNMKIQGVSFLTIEQSNNESPLWGAWAENSAENPALSRFRQLVREIVHA